MSVVELLGLGFAIPHFHLTLSPPSLAMFFFLPLGMAIFSVIVIKSIKLGYFCFYKDTQIRVCLESQKRLGTFAHFNSLPLWGLRRLNWMHFSIWHNHEPMKSRSRMLEFGGKLSVGGSCVWTLAPHGGTILEDWNRKWVARSWASWVIAWPHFGPQSLLPGLPRCIYKPTFLYPQMLLLLTCFFHQRHLNFHKVWVRINLSLFYVVSLTMTRKTDYKYYLCWWMILNL